jgi:hypothetical protein
MKPFPKTPRKIVTITIEEDGTQTFLKTDAADIFLELGEVITRRASHVEPAGFWLRLAFTALRSIFPDTGKVAAWTRTWCCLWRVNTSPVGGPVLKWFHVLSPRTAVNGITSCPYPCWNQVATWRDRQSAIEAEVKFLNQFFLERII